jgi:membrane protease YdiL (CAAX protease family)
MNPITSFIKRHPQITFWGIAWSTSFFGFYMRALYPSDLWLFFIYGSFLGGALVTGIADGREGLKTYFSRIVRWRVGIKWLIIALFTPLVLRLIASGLTIATGAKIVENAQLPGLGDAVFGFLFILIVVALGEEPGFRGFALPRLLEGRSALSASLILGVLHTIWHLPLFITGEDAAIPTTLIIISGARLNTWLFNKTNGSVFIAMFLHASVNLWVDVFNPFFSAPDVQKLTVWLAVAFVAMGILLPILTGKELGRKTDTAKDTLAAEQPAMAS